MKISIAMTTYNGEKYLQEQLDSFLLQTRQPDELIVVDDCSTDNSIGILIKFKELAPFEVNIIQNKENVGSKSKYGYAKNFEKAIRESSGDVVFFSDQDDVWFKDKIANHLAVLSEKSNVSMIANNAIRTYSDLTHNNLTQTEYVERSSGQAGIVLIGCCFSFRKEFVDQFLPIPEHIGHDVWFSMCAKELDLRFDIPEPLQFFRRTSNSWSVINEFSDCVTIFDCYLTRLKKIIKLYTKDFIHKFDLQSTLEINQKLLQLCTNYELHNKIAYDKEKQEKEVILLQKRQKIVTEDNLQKRLFKIKKLLNSDNSYRIKSAIKDFLAIYLIGL